MLVRNFMLFVDGLCGCCMSCAVVAKKFEVGLFMVESILH